MTIIILTEFNNFPLFSNFSREKLVIIGIFNHYFLTFIFFSREKVYIIRNMESEQEILDYIRAGKLKLPPLSIGIPNLPFRLQTVLSLEISWSNNRYNFVGEIRRYSSDRVIIQAASQVRSFALAQEVLPLIIVPWLSHDQLVLLEKQGVSGIDLCGNGVIVVPGQLLFFRSGQPNNFPSSRPIRRVYEGTTSLVARVFLLKPEYQSVSEILEEIILRGGSTTLPTISKALKQLEEDVVIEKSKKLIRLLQPEKLLDLLKANYAPPKPRARYCCKLATSKNKSIRKILQEAAEKEHIKLVLSGESSVNYYATMAREPIDTFYCTDFTTLNLVKSGAIVDDSSRFPNVELRKTDSEAVYFDRREQDGIIIASPIQTYLELATSEKRAQETAEIVREQILGALAKQPQKRARNKSK